MADEPRKKVVVAALGRPPWQRIADPPLGLPGNPGAQAARWMAELDADLAAPRISPAVYEQRKRAIMDWLAKA
jgi:hypothetical protein